MTATATVTPTTVTEAALAERADDSDRPRDSDSDCKPAVKSGGRPKPVGRVHPSPPPPMNSRPPLRAPRAVQAAKSASEGAESPIVPRPKCQLTPKVPSPPPRPPPPHVLGRAEEGEERSASARALPVLTPRPPPGPPPQSRLDEQSWH
eukprot:14562796-Alexandrium_andersonii.AAC.1